MTPTAERVPVTPWCIIFLARDRYSSHCLLSLQPKVVTDIEDEELKRQMEELQLANQEVAGDDDTSDQEVGEMEEES